MPLFGTLVSGPTGVIVVIALAAVWLWLGVMWYQIKVAGWWGLAVVPFVMRSVPQSYVEGSVKDSGEQSIQLGGCLG